MTQYTYTIYYTDCHPKHGRYVGCTSRALQHRSNEIGAPLTVLEQVHDRDQAIALERSYKKSLGISLKGDTGCFIGGPGTTSRSGTGGGNPTGWEQANADPVVVRERNSRAGLASARSRAKCRWCDLESRLCSVVRHEKLKHADKYYPR